MGEYFCYLMKIEENFIVQSKRILTMTNKYSMLLKEVIKK